MNNFLKSRRSVRDFKNKKVELSVLETIAPILSELESEEATGSLNFKLYEYGEHIYEGLKGKAGYSGVMIESPHYIALELKNIEDHTIIYGAYFMEKLISKLNDKGLDTCWISLTNVDSETKNEIFGESNGEVNNLLAFGYPKRRNPFTAEPFSERIGVEELVFNGKIPVRADIDNLESKGLMDLFYYVRFAPSTKNFQPWRFLLEDHNVKLLLRYNDGENPLLIDAGIIMYYFEALANLQGIKSKWNFIDGVHKEGTINYKYIAEFHL